MINLNAIPNKRPNELVLAHLWPHPLVFIGIFLSYLVLFVIPPVIYAFINFVTPGVFDNLAIMPVLLALMFAYYLLIMVFMLTVWMDNYLDVDTLTNERLILRTQKGLFNRTVSDIELYRIQNVSVNQKGLFKTIFNYGDVKVETAGEDPGFVLASINNPIKISRLIQRLDETAKNNRNTSE
ncbi:MAG: PH domain-containing protein [Patescibacteria group bacterium]|jgi:uncharacterized membrane protein YdbT with pleckstrin-like domain